MTDNEKDEDTKFQQTTSDFLSLLTKSYNFIQTPSRIYLQIAVIPSFIIMCLIVGLALYLAQIPISATMSIVGVGLFTVTTLYPIGAYSQYKNKMDSEFPLFITYITALSMSNTNRVNIFREVVNSNEYDSISKEINKLLSQIDNLNQSLDEAALVRSKETPSEVFSGFYEKLSYSLSSGQPIAEFLDKEQQNVIDDYVTNYEYRISQLEYVMQMFIGFTTAVSFLFTIIMIIPLLIGFDIVLIFAFSIAGYLLTQVSFLFVVNSVAPKDYLWYLPRDTITKKKQRIYLSLVIGLMMSSIISVYVFIVGSPIPFELSVPIIVLPMMIPSIVIFNYERSIYKLEDRFGSFIQSVGTIESVKRTSTAEVLRTLKKKDFGALDDRIQKLYNRLNLNIDAEEAWDKFSQDTGSKQIRVFSNMYHLGRRLGVDSENLSSLIRRNYKEIKSLRKSRSSTVSKLKTNLYFSFFAFVAIVLLVTNIIQSIISDLEPSTQDLDLPILFFGSYNFDIIYTAIYLVIILNGIILGIIIRVAQRRYILGFVIHTTIYVSLSFVVAYGIGNLTSSII